MLTFVLPIVPTAQARARHATRNGYAVAYKSGRQQSNERTLEACLKEHAPSSPMAGPVVLEFIAAMPMPQSASRKKKIAMMRGALLPTKKPDLDNLAKQLKDAMTRLQFWQDDKQVVELRCRKIYSETGSWRVRVSAAAQEGM